MRNPSPATTRTLSLCFIVLVGMSASNSSAPAQTTQGDTVVLSNELTACKATALIALNTKGNTIKDIFIDQEGLTSAAADTHVEDTPIKHIIMGEAYLQTNKQDKPRRFLCLIGEKGKVLLTFFTQQ